MAKAKKATKAKQKKRKPGFGGFSADELREITSKGGKQAHANGNAHEFSSEEAREAGAKGGKKVAKNKKYMAEIGRKGGLARWKKAKGGK